MPSFREQIQAHAGTGGFVSRVQERALVRLGTAGYGLDYEQARGALLEASITENLVLESEIESGVADYLTARAGRSGRVPRAAFLSAVDLYRARTGNRLGQASAESRVKDLMIRRGLAPRASGLLFRNRRWFNRIPMPVDGAADAAAIQAIETQVQAPVNATLAAWASAFNARDVPGILALYAPNALLLATAAAEPLRGPEAMRGYFQNLVIAQSGSVQFGMTLAVDGTDPAVASGLYAFSYTDPARGPVTTPARFSFAVTHGGAGPIGLIIQHHSSAIPTAGVGNCPV